MGSGAAGALMKALQVPLAASGSLGEGDDALYYAQKRVPHTVNCPVGR